MTLPLASVALIADVAIWALSFASPHVNLPESLFAPFFGLALALMGVAAISWRGSHPSPRTRMPISLKHYRGPLRSLLQVAVALAVVAVITGFISLLISLPGQPGYNAATRQYYFDNHGSVTVTTRLHYLYGIALQTRAFISFAVLFTLVAAITLDGERRARHKVPVARLSEIPLPKSEPPHWTMRVIPGAILLVLAATFVGVGFDGVVSGVDDYLASPHLITVSGVTEHLSAGPQVVFGYCETDAIDAPYGCPTLTPSDIVISALSTGADLTASPDPSSDRVSPHDIPAIGRLRFDAPVPGRYRFRLTRSIAKGVFIAESPGTITRGVTVDIVFAVLGIVGVVAGSLLLLRRLLWRVSGAPPVEIPPNWNAVA